MTTDTGRSQSTDEGDGVSVVSRPVCELTRHDFNALVLNDHGDSDEWTFTDDDPVGYPQTMGTLVTLERT